jgi:hypothetical protein
MIFAFKCPRLNPTGRLSGQSFSLRQRGVRDIDEKRGEAPKRPALIW